MLNVEIWGLNWINFINLVFIGDFMQDCSVTFLLDIKVNNIFSIEDGIEVLCYLMVELCDYVNYVENGIWISVWFDFGSISQVDGWQYLFVMIVDIGFFVLLVGWSYYDGMDVMMLLQGVSFLLLLKGVDEIVFLMIVNGNFYDYCYFDVIVDNIGVIMVVFELVIYVMLGVGLLVIGLMWVCCCKNG